ncbi:hypothetical protein T484DRAFT_1814226, partial [Baffinella frigidus]
IGTGWDALVVVGTQPGTLSAAFSYDKPEVDGLQSDTGDAASWGSAEWGGHYAGGTDLTISGSNFGTSDYDAAAFVGGDVVSDSSIICETPPAPGWGAGDVLDCEFGVCGMDFAVVVEVGGQVADENAAFIYSCGCVDGSGVCLDATYIGGVFDDWVCDDVDECVGGTGGSMVANCDSDATCSNTWGSFTCECDVGYDDDSASTDALSTTN